MTRSLSPLRCVVLWAACATPSDDDAGTTETSAGTSVTSAATNTATTTSSDPSAASSRGDTTATTTTASADDGSDGDGSSGEPMAPCEDPNLVWHTGNKTNYESYPDPGSKECIEFNGCKYVGQFSECENTMPERWVAAHDIAAVFPLGDLGLRRLCLRSGDASIIVTVLDTCADSDCDGCCTENLGDAEALIDLEKYTNERFGIEDGEIEWADLGPGDPGFDGCN